MTKIDYVKRIRKAGLSIYDELSVDSELRIPKEDLEKILLQNLRGIDTENLPPRTRSKILKMSVCQAMGYGIPTSFKRTQPRFPGQDLDLFVQKSSNLQIWNESVQLARRYAIVIVSPNGKVENVFVLTGSEVQALDKTRKLTSKYQAILRTHHEHGLLSPLDTLPIKGFFARARSGNLMSIKKIYETLKTIEGMTFDYSGASRERNRGIALQDEVSKRLGYPDYKDNGQFPDLRPQLLEIKLQTARTIDLGLVMPDSKEPIENLNLDDYTVTPSDIRYAIFDAKRIDSYKTLRIRRLFLVTGAEFFNFFNLMKGKGINKKLQIPLPKSFFT